MLGKIIFFLIAWSLLKKVVKAIRPEEARLDSGRKEGKRARKDELGQDAAVEPNGPASDMIRWIARIPSLPRCFPARARAPAATVARCTAPAR